VERKSPLQAPQRTLRERAVCGLAQLKTKKGGKVHYTAFAKQGAKRLSIFFYMQHNLFHACHSNFSLSLTQTKIHGKAHRIKKKRRAPEGNLPFLFR
jgi:hypothetical protein